MKTEILCYGTLLFLLTKTLNLKWTLIRLDMDSVLNKLLTTLTDNKEFNQEKPAGGNALYSGLPHGFGASTYDRYRPQVKKPIDPAEYETDLIEQITKFNEAVATHKSRKLEIESIRIKLINSKIELGKLIAEGESEYMEVIKTKYQLIENVLQESILDKKSSKPKREITDKQTPLTQPQVIVLFHYLQSTGILAQSLNNTLYSSAISDLTGLSSEKIRQGLSTVSKYSESIDAVRFTDEDFKEVISQLKKLLEKINERVNSN